MNDTCLFDGNERYEKRQKNLDLVRFAWICQNVLSKQNTNKERIKKIIEKINT